MFRRWTLTTGFQEHENDTIIIYTLGSKYSLYFRIDPPRNSQNPIQRPYRWSKLCPLDTC